MDWIDVVLIVTWVLVILVAAPLGFRSSQPLAKLLAGIAIITAVLGFVLDSNLLVLASAHPLLMGAYVYLLALRPRHNGGDDGWGS